MVKFLRRKVVNYGKTNVSIFSNRSIIFDFPATSTHCMFFGTFRWSFIDFKSDLVAVWINASDQWVRRSWLITGIWSKLVEKSRSLRDLIRVVVLLSFFSSMFLTNDVAILTLLPIYLLLTRQEQQRTSVILGAVYLIVAANLGSSLFPFGNPQNLFLFSYYHISLGQFMWTTGTFVGLSLLLLLVSVQLISKSPLGNHYSRRRL